MLESPFWSSSCCQACFPSIVLLQSQFPPEALLFPVPVEIGGPIKARLAVDVFGGVAIILQVFAPWASCTRRSVRSCLQGCAASDLREEQEEAPRNLDAAEDLEISVVLQAGVAFHEALMIPKQPAVAAPTRVGRRDEDVVEAEDAILAAPPAAIVLPSTLEGAGLRRDGLRNLYDKYAVTRTYYPRCSKRRYCMASQTLPLCSMRTSRVSGCLASQEHERARDHVFNCRPTLEEQQLWLQVMGHVSSE